MLLIPAYKIGFNSAVERRSIKDIVEKQTLDFFEPKKKKKKKAGLTALSIQTVHILQ